MRIRREDEEYYLTYKGRGLLAREEYNLPLNEEAYRHLLEKADGIHIEKRRYRIPLNKFPPLTAELDIFAGAYQGLKLVEVDFPLWKKPAPLFLRNGLERMSPYQENTRTAGWPIHQRSFKSGLID